MRWRFSQSNRRRYRIVGAIFLAILLAGLGRLLLPLAAEFLVVDTFGGKNADFVLVLSGEFPDRALEAGALYREGRVSRIILTRDQESAGYHSAEKMGVALQIDQQRAVDLLERMQVPKEHVYALRPTCFSTVDEARLLVQFLRGLRSETTSKPVPRIVLVTSQSHSRRALYIFRKIVGILAEIEVRPSRFDAMAVAQAKQGWWKSAYFLRQVLLEYQKLIFWRLGFSLGLTK